MTEVKTFPYSSERLDPEVRPGYSWLHEAYKLRYWIDGLVGSVAIRKAGELLESKPPKKAKQDLGVFLASKRDEGIGVDGEDVILGSGINRETKQPEEIRVNPWDFEQVRALVNKRNILNVAIETFDRYLHDFEDSPTQANRSAQQDSLTLIRSAIDRLYQPKMIKEGGK